MMSERKNPVWIYLVVGIAILSGVKFGLNQWVSANELPPRPSYQKEHRLSDLEGLLHLAHIGDLGGVRHMIDQGISLNAANTNGETALSMALRTPNNPVVPFCLAQGFIPTTEYQDANGGRGFTGDVALFWAASSGRTDVTKALIQAGTLTDGPQDRQRSALAVAVAKGHHEIVKLLVEKGADTRGLFFLDNKDTGREPPRETLPLICFPIRTHDLSTLLQLLSLKVTVNPVINISALSMAISADWAEAVQALLEAGADPDELDMGGNKFDKGVKSREVRGLLLSARAVKHFTNLSNVDARQTPAKEFIKLLFQPDSAPVAKLIGKLPLSVLSVRDDRGWTLPMYALQAEKPELVGALLEQGVLPNLFNADGLSLAGMATEMDNRSVLEVLAQKGADLDAYGAKGHSPLALAIAHKNASLTNWLLELGVKVEPVGPPARTPLMWALRNRDQPLSIRLLKDGAQVNKRDAQGWPVVFYAALSGMPELLEQVEKRGVSLKNETHLAGPLLLQAIRNHALLEVRFLLDIGVVQTAEMVAAALGQPEMLDLLEEFSQRHEDARARGNNFWRQLSALSREQVVEHLNSSRDQNFRGDMTPLQRAIQTGRQDVIRLLVERGVDANQTGIRELLPPLLLLVQSEIIAIDKDKADLIRMLAGRGAQLDVCTEESAGGQTALMICLERHLLDSARQLLLSGADGSLSDSQGRLAIDYLNDDVPATAEAKAVWELLAAAGSKLSTPGKDKKSLRGLEL